MRRQAATTSASTTPSQLLEPACFAIVNGTQCARQPALERQDLSRTYLAHHELESRFIIVIIVIIIITITTTTTIIIIIIIIMMLIRALTPL